MEGEGPSSLLETGLSAVLSSPIVGEGRQTELSLNSPWVCPHFPPSTSWWPTEQFQVLYYVKVHSEWVDIA